MAGGGVEAVREPDNLPTWICPYCGKPVGYLGRAWAWLVGVRVHGCDFSLYKARHGIRSSNKETPDAS